MESIGSFRCIKIRREQTGLYSKIEHISFPLQSLFIGGLGSPQLMCNNLWLTENMESARYKVQSKRVDAPPFDLRLVSTKKDPDPS